MEYLDKDIEEYRDALQLFEDLETNLGELVLIRYVSVSRDINNGIIEEEGHLFQINRFIDMDIKPIDYYEGPQKRLILCHDGSTQLHNFMNYSFSGNKMILSITDMDGKDLYYNPYLEAKTNKNNRLNNLLSSKDINLINHQMFGEIVGDILDNSTYRTESEEIMTKLEQKLPKINPRPTGRRKILE